MIHEDVFHNSHLDSFKFSYSYLNKHLLVISLIIIIICYFCIYYLYIFINIYLSIIFIYYICNNQYSPLKIILVIRVLTKHGGCFILYFNGSSKISVSELYEVIIDRCLYYKFLLNNYFHMHFVL